MRKPNKKILHSNKKNIFFLFLVFIEKMNLIDSFHIFYFPYQLRYKVCYFSIKFSQMDNPFKRESLKSKDILLLGSVRTLVYLPVNITDSYNC